MENNLSISRQLKKFGVGAGYQIMKAKRPIKKVPDWVNDDDKIREILIVSFPNMKKDSREKARAGRWLRIIYLYYRRQWGRGQIAHEMKLTYHVVNRIIFRIRACAEGLRTDGKKRKLHKRVATRHA